MLELNIYLLTSFVAAYFSAVLQSFFCTTLQSFCFFEATDGVDSELAVLGEAIGGGGT